MMNHIFRVFSIAALFITGLANAEIVRFEQIKQSPIKVEQPFIISSDKAKVYVTSGTGKSIRLLLKKQSGETVITQTKDLVDIDDTFVIDGVSYYGNVFELSSIPEGVYTIVVQRGNLDVINQFTIHEYPLVVELTPPSINGSFFWNSSSTGYWRTHDDGKFVITTTGARNAGFTGVSPSLSGISSATFSATFIDGPNAGKTHASNLPASLTPDSRVVIGSGVDNSISSAYVPANTAARMKFTYKIRSKAGLSAEKSEELYVATRPAQSKPQPFAVFTGVNTSLDGIGAFKGFVAYTPNMPVANNPVRMIYRANRSHYYGGGGDADIYGAWVNSTRNLTRLVHSDAQYLYFDITGSSDGTKINEGSFYIRDLSTYRHFLFEHALSLDESNKAPEVTEIAYYLNGAAKWFTHASSLTTYITKDNTNGTNDAIGKIRITVKPRAYNQRFNYDFPVGPRYQGQCIIPASQVQCTVDTNLPYPANDINTYHNRHRVTGVGNSLLSNEVMSNWIYDGSPAIVEDSSISQDIAAKTVTFRVKKDFVTRAWSNSQIRSVKLVAVPQTKPTDRINLPQLNLSSVQIDGSQYNTYTFSYSSLSEGKFGFIALVEDGFTSATFRHKREHKILDAISLDFTPPVIKTNLTAKPLTSLTSLMVTLTDASNAYVQKMAITGGAENINFSLPFQLKSANTYSPEYIFLNPSEDKPFTLTVTALDEMGNKRVASFDFIYQPQLTRMPDTKIPAVASALRDEKGVPNNVLLTPQIRNSDGAPAKGNHKIYFSLNPTAQAALKVNGIEVSPGQTVAFTSNLSATNHRLRLVMHPLESGKATDNNFQIHIPDIKIALCPESFEENGTSCIYLSYKEPNSMCPDGFSQVEDTQTCQKVFTYQPKTDCAEGYTLDNLTCKGSYNLSPITTCPSSFGLSEAGQACNRTTAQPVKYCSEGQTYEEGMCKDPEGNFSPSSTYCNGVDVSKAPTCQNGMCTSFNEQWNACETNIRITPTIQCPEGKLQDGVCVVPYSYNLNASCPFGYNREGLNCTRLEIVDPIKSCDIGWEKDSTGCFKQDYAPFNSCPPSHILKGGRCHEKAAIIITCPDTYTWNGTSCAREDKTDAIPVCPAEHTWSLVNNRCEQLKSEPATPVCAEGKTWSDISKSCESTLTQPATPNCNAGFAWSELTAQCEQENIKPAIPECPSDAPWDGLKCTKVENRPALPICPESYNWNGMLCEKTENQGATPVCESGFIWSVSENKCQQTQTKPYIKSCGPDFTYNETKNLCERKLSQDAVPNCQPGFIWSSESKTCLSIKKVPANIVCDAGFVTSEQNENCEITVTTPATPVCPIGYTWQVDKNECQMLQTQVATPVCPVDYTWSSLSSRCEKTTSQPASAICPVDYVWSEINKECQKVESQPHNKNCSIGMEYNPSNGLCEKTVLQPAKPLCSLGFTWSATNLRCEATTTQTATPNCAPSYVWSVTKNICEKLTSQAATVNCPLDYTWSSEKQQCEKFQSQDATPVCPALHNWSPSNKRCENLVTQAPTQVCNPGYVYSSINNRCEQSEIVSATRFCPMGSNWSEVNARCEKTVTQAATPNCSLGYNWSHTNKRCEKTEKQPATLMSCKASHSWDAWDSRVDETVRCNVNLVTSGNLLGGNCYYGSRTACEVEGTCVSQSLPSDNPCDEGVTTPYNFTSCPLGWSLSGGECSRTLTAPISGYSCDAGWELASDKCIQLETSLPTYSCNSEWVLSGNTCSRLLTQPVTLTCPSEWTLSDSLCKQLQTANASYSCPLGWTLTSSTCSKLETSGSTYSCPPAWDLSGEICNQIHTQNPISFSCPPEWSLSDTICSQLLTQPPSSYACDAGWSLSNEQCALLTVQPPSTSCNPGWNDNGSNCVRTLTQQPLNYSCSSGWNLSDKFCNQTLTSIPTFTCSPGWALSEQQCTLLLAEPATLFKCNDGWDLSGNICSQKQTKAPADYKCDEGWILGVNECSLTEMQPPISYECIAGWTLLADKCSLITTETPINNCEPDFTDNGSLCSKLISTPPTNFACSPGWNLNINECSRVLTVAAEFVCEADWSKSGSNCTKTTSTDPQSYSCDSGWTLSDKSCHQTLSESPVSFTCGSGWTLDTAMCSKVLKADPVSYQCKSGWDLSIETCNILVFSDPDSYRCEFGWNLFGKECTRQSTETETRSCKPTFLQQDPETCFKETPADFVGLCEAEWSVMATQCMLTTKKDFNLSCEPAFDLVSQQCRRTLNQPVTVECQKGDILVDGRCESKLTTPVTNTCDAPYALIDKQCRNRIEINNFDQI